MENFDYQLSTKIHFGKNTISENLGKEILNYGKKVFFVYDQNPVKASGLYDQIIRIFQENEIEFVEFTGIEPNPRHTTVNRGIELLKQFKADCILAAGGGSTIDTGKAISFGFFYDGDVWDFYEKKVEVTEVLPVIAIPTLAASGAEVSYSSIVSNLELKRKAGVKSEKIRPQVALLDPTLTFSVPKYHTACGIIDIMSHTYEAYFSNDFGIVQDGFSESIQRTCLINGKKVMEDPKDYDARGQLMWSAALSISMISSLGRKSRFSAIHTIEHLLSAYFDIIHGAGIAIVSIAWFKYCLDHNPDAIKKFAQWGRNVFEIALEDDEQTAKEAIDEFERFVHELGLKTSLSELNINRDDVNRLIENEYHRLKNSNQWFASIDSKEDLHDLFDYVL